MKSNHKLLTFQKSSTIRVGSLENYALFLPFTLSCHSFQHCRILLQFKTNGEAEPSCEQLRLWSGGRTTLFGTDILLNYFFNSLKSALPLISLFDVYIHSFKWVLTSVNKLSFPSYLTSTLTNFTSIPRAQHISFPTYLQVFSVLLFILSYFVLLGQLFILLLKQ